MIYGRIGNRVLDHVSASLHAHMADKKKVKFNEFIEFSLSDYRGVSVEDFTSSVNGALNMYRRSWNQDREPDTYVWLPYIDFENISINRNGDIIVVSFKTRYYWKDESGKRITTL